MFVCLVVCSPTPTPSSPLTPICHDLLLPPPPPTHPLLLVMGQRPGNKVILSHPPLPPNFAPNPPPWILSHKFMLMDRKFSDLWVLNLAKSVVMHAIVLEEAVDSQTYIMSYRDTVHTSDLLAHWFFFFKSRCDWFIELTAQYLCSKMLVLKLHLIKPLWRYRETQKFDCLTISLPKGFCCRFLVMAWGQRPGNKVILSCIILPLPLPPPPTQPHCAIHLLEFYLINLC